jgi:hypothetical protein
MRTLAFTYHSRSDFERARALHEQNLSQARVLGYTDMEAATLGSLAMIAFDQGRIDDAIALGKLNLLACRDLGSLHGIAQALCRSANTIAVLSGKADLAAQLLACFDAQREKIGISEAWVTRMNTQTLSTVRASLDEITFAGAWEKGRALTIAEAVALALESLN